MPGVRRTTTVPASAMPERAQRAVSSTVDSDEGEQEQERERVERPKKKMRKGTRSCTECRRRKVRCIFESALATSCNDCVARGARCVSQADDEPVPDPRKNLKDRVNKLEELVEKLLAGKGYGTDSLRGLAVDAGIDVDLASPYRTPLDIVPAHTGVTEIAPTLSLFNNAIFGRKETEEAVPASEDSSTLDGSGSPGSASSPETPAPTTLKTKHDTIRRALTRTLPSERDLDTLSRRGGGWWIVWRDLCGSIMEGTGELSLSAVLRRSLDNGHPAVIARALLCIAVTIQQVPGDFDDSVLNLPLSADSLMKHYMMLIDRLIIYDNEFSNSLDGLDCMILQGKLQVNLGQPRQAWSTIRRAMSFAVLLGLHRDPIPLGEKASVQMIRRRRIFWRIYEDDRTLSLLLGLPHAIPDSHCNLDLDELGDIETPELYRRRLAQLAGRVIDRNQNVRGPDLTFTLELDQELDQLGQRLPSKWWSMGQHEQENRTNRFVRLMSQYWFYQVRALLHLPFFLRSLTDANYEYSRLLCLDSSRQMIRRYAVLRANRQSGAYFCKLVDFQGFTAALLLLLHLFGTGRFWPESGHQSEKDMNQEDSAMVDQTIEHLRTVYREENSIVAKQAYEVLETFQKTRQTTCKGENCTLVVPFFGTITFGPGSGFAPDGTLVNARTTSKEGAMSAAASTVSPANQPSNGLGPSPTSIPSVSHGNNVLPTPALPLPMQNIEPQMSLSSFYGAYDTDGAQAAIWQPANMDDTAWQNILSMDLDQDWNLTLGGSADSLQPQAHAGSITGLPTLGVSLDLPDGMLR